jgi:hypothetical protein
MESQTRLNELANSESRLVDCGETLRDGMESQTKLGGLVNSESQLVDRGGTLLKERYGTPFVSWAG